jgi:hypothetical protein
MWMVLLIAMADANPERVMGRVGESLRVRSYATVDGDGPVRGRWRRTNGNIVGQVFRDSVFERYTRRDGRVPQQTIYYNAAGMSLGELAYVEGTASTFTVTTPALDPMDVSTWQASAHHGLSLTAPLPTSSDEQSTTWQVGAGKVEVLQLPAEDPTTDAFRISVEQSCGCLLLDRHTAWIDGRSGIRLLLDVPAPGRGERAEIWAFPTDEHLITVWGSWPIEDPSAYATLRAMVSLATWESP